MYLIFFITHICRRNNKCIFFIIHNNSRCWLLMFLIPQNVNNSLIKLKVQNLEEFSFNPSSFSFSLSLSLSLSLSRNVSYTFQDKLLFSGCTKIRTHIKRGKIGFSSSFVICKEEIMFSSWAAQFWTCR